MCIWRCGSVNRTWQCILTYSSNAKAEVNCRIGKARMWWYQYGNHLWLQMMARIADNLTATISSWLMLVTNVQETCTRNLHVCHQHDLLSDRRSESIITSVRPSMPFSTDTDTPIFCCQPMPIPMRYASRADVAQRDWQIKGSRRRRRN